MDKLKALLTAEIDYEAFRFLEDYIDIEYEGWFKNSEILAEENLAQLIVGKDILITSYDPVTKYVMDSSPNLKLIVCTRATPVNIDINYARQKGIKVSYAPNRNSDCTAEFTVALMLSITRKIPMAHMDLHNGKYTGSEKTSTDIRDGLKRDVTWSLGKDTPYVAYKGIQLRGHKVGIIGYGGIGRRVGAICHAFGMDVLVSDPYLTQTDVEDYAKLLDFNEVLSQSDIITVHCKDVPETEKLINEEAFNHMKKSAYFINTSRGILVDESALIQALRDGKIAGAAIDVYNSEPIAENHPYLKELNNVVTTPHLAGATYDAITNHTHQLATDILHFIHHEELEFEYKK